MRDGNPFSKADIGQTVCLHFQDGEPVWIYHDYDEPCPACSADPDDERLLDEP